MIRTGRRRRRRYWDKPATSYDRQIGYVERALFGDSRQWVCLRASGRRADRWRVAGASPRLRSALDDVAEHGIGRSSR